MIKEALRMCPVFEFNFDEWLHERSQKPDLVVVELGHGIRPLAQVQDFPGDRAYIGIEAKLNTFHYGNAAPQVIGRLLIQKPDQNIFFVAHSVDKFHRRPTDARTILPDSSADEVFVRNVLGDPKIGSEEEVFKVFQEAARLVTGNGKVVISENNTPFELATTRSLARQVGLMVDGEVFPGTMDWDNLQEVYVTERNREHWSGYSPESYYLILSRAGASPSGGQMAA